MVHRPKARHGGSLHLVSGVDSAARAFPLYSAGLGSAVADSAKW